jgi:hypothetical protein
MLRFFRPQLPIDVDELDWMLACFRWFAIEFEGTAYPRRAILTLPDAETFPPSRARGHDRALEVFEIVKRRAGLATWPCDLLAGAAPRDRHIATGHALRPITRPEPLGTFGFAAGRYRITYNPSALANLHTLTAIFAHELAHYLLHSARTPPPGVRVLEEHATDLAAVYLGFGLFMANSARNFAQFQDFAEHGWQMQTQGYLSEAALTTALALFLRLHDLATGAVERELKPYLRAPFRRATKAIARLHPDLPASVAAIDLADWDA